MTDDKIRISLDEVQNPQVDDKLQRQAAERTVQPTLQCFSSPVPSVSHPVLPSAQISPPPQLLWIAGGGLVFVIVAVAGLVIHFAGNSSQPSDSSQRKLAEATHIESVLQQDATTHAGAQTVAEVVTRMRSIELTGCPNDFKSAYLAHIHAWEVLADVERQAIALKTDSESSGVLVESFIRGFLGDPFGKMNEITAAQNQLQRSYQAATQQVRDSFHRVEENAVSHGANLPKNK